MDGLLKLVGFVALVYAGCRIVLKLQLNPPIIPRKLTGKRQADCDVKYARVASLREHECKQKYLSFMEKLMSKINLDDIPFDEDKELLKKCIQAGLEHNACPFHFHCLPTAHGFILPDEHKGACDECWGDCSFADRNMHKE